MNFTSTAPQRALMAPPGTPDGGVLVVGVAPKVRHPRETRALPWPPVVRIPETLDEALEIGGSEAGLSAVSNWLSCPERSRLSGLGVRQKVRERPDGVLEKLAARELGTIVHLLVSVRLVYGLGMAYELIGPVKPGDAREYGLGLSYEDRLKLWHIITTYDQSFPVELEPFEYLGVEVEVFTDIGDGRGGSCIRSVRYDSVVRFKPEALAEGAPPGVFSLELKTDSRGGESAMNVYMPQLASHCALWNSNPNLVATWGPMLGAIPNVIVKNVVPRCERMTLRYIPRFMQQRITEYHRLPGEIPFKVKADGSYPRMFHTCWGRYRPCEFIGLCWSNESGNYEVIADESGS